jgi:hypothetical protein
MNKPRFLTYRLGDNDFGSCMEHAMRWIVEQFGPEFIRDLPDERVLAAMANYMAGETMAEHVMRGYTLEDKFCLEWYYNYLVTAKIDRTEEGAHADGDGSYVSVDFSTGYIWRH